MVIVYSLLLVGSIMDVLLMSVLLGKGKWVFKEGLWLVMMSDRSVSSLPGTLLGVCSPASGVVRHLAKKSVGIHGFTGCRSSIRWAVCLSLVG